MRQRTSVLKRIACARVLAWSAVAAISGGALLVASGRSERMQRTDQALERAQRLTDAGQYAQAGAVLLRVTADEPRCLRAHAALAEVRSSQGHTAQALDEYRAVAELQPDDAQACYDLAACALCVERYDIAERYLSRRLRDFPQDAYARRFLAFVRERRQQPQAAQDQHQPTAAVPPHEQTAARWIARMRQRAHEQVRQTGG